MHAISIVSLLTGCAGLEEIKDQVEDVTDPFVVEAWYLGVAEPDDVDLSGTEFEKGSAVEVFLADAENVDQIESAPITDATVTLRSDTNGSITLAPHGDGGYGADGSDGLTYQNGEEVTIVVERDGTHRVAVQAPAEAQADIPAQHTQGEPLIVDLSGQDFDNVLVTVFDVSTGNVTFDNTPSGIEDIYEFAHGDGASRVEVPGSAFPHETAYAVAVAGLRRGDADAMEEVNTALSAFMAGKIKFYAISTFVLPEE